MRYSESLTAQAHELSLYCGQPLIESFSLPVSCAADFFGGKAFTVWKKTKEHEAKVQMAIIERLDNLSKIMAKRR